MPVRFNLSRGRAMAKYSIWNTGAGAVTLSVRALRPFVMSTRLSLIANGVVIPLVGTTNSGIDDYALDAAIVSQLRSAPTSTNPPSLLFSCGAIYHPGAPDRKWGGGMRVSRAGTVLPCVDENGAALPLDSKGFRQTSLRTFPAGKNVTAGLDLITFI